MDPVAEPMRMFGQVPDAEPLSWSWARDRLEQAVTYWVVPSGDGSAGDGHPHPRPVWGVLADDRLWLSIGSPVVRRQLARRPEVTVHLDSGLEVVIVEGLARTGTTEDRDPVTAYDAKYDWEYSVDDYGPLTPVSPVTVFAWRAAGPAGRDGFRQVGRWSYPD